LSMVEAMSSIVGSNPSMATLGGVISSLIVDA
jgi:hypothetical protein